MMKKFVYLFPLLIFSLLLLPACVKESDSPDGPDPVAVGMPCPRFDIETLDGALFSTNRALKGELLLVFFNTECPDCQRELPLVQLYYEHTLRLPADTRPTLMCISREEDARSVRKYWDENGFTMPVAADKGRTVYSLFASSGIPKIYRIVDGIVVATDLNLSPSLPDTPL